MSAAEKGPDEVSSDSEASFEGALQLLYDRLPERQVIPRRLADRALQLFNNRLPLGWRIESASPDIECIENTDTKMAFELAFGMADRLFGSVGLSSPTPDQFLEAGVNFGALATRYEDLSEKEKKPPLVVVAPCLPIGFTDKGVDYGSPNTRPDWQSIYQQLANNSEYGNQFFNPVLFGVDGLEVNDIVATVGSEILDQERIYHRQSGKHRFVSVGGVDWTIFVASSKDNLSGSNKSHNNFMTNEPDPLSLSQYLALQANSLMTFGYPIDAAGTKTWLYVNFEATSHGSRQGLYGTTDSQFPKICVKLSGYGEHSKKTGSRPIAY